LLLTSQSVNADLTGNARQLTITNTGNNEATGLSITYPTWPAGTPITTASSTCGNTLAPATHCIIIISPGSDATSNCNTGIVPTPGTIRVSATNVAATLTSEVVVLNYGCIYQGGFIYSVDDNTPPTGSIGGKIAAVTDNVSGQTSSSIATIGWGGYGTDIGSALYDNSAQGANEGSANSAAIIRALAMNYSRPHNGPSPELLSSDYAAGWCSSLSVDATGASSCTVPNTCYTNWYLPAICELGPFKQGATCTTTNIQQQLFENTLISKATLGLVTSPGHYWSSTEFLSYPSDYAWYESFGDHNVQQGYDGKGSSLNVRCSRSLSVS
jgi:hypothetical protein